MVYNYLEMKSINNSRVEDIDSRHIGEVEILESELLEAHRKMMTGSMRIKLMKSLLKKGLCLRDIYSFVSNQTDIQEVNTVLDRKTITSAMNAKIKDIRMAVSIHQRNKRRREKDLLQILGGETRLWRQKLKQIRHIVKDEKGQLQKKYDKKIDHYSKTQDLLRHDGRKVQNNTVAPTSPPRYLGEYSSLSVFDNPEELKERKKDEPLGPFVTSKSIKLSFWENKLLSKDPKFSLKFDPDEMVLSTEIERMNSKVRYDLGSKNKNEKLNRITTPEGKPIDWKQDEVNNSTQYNGDVSEQLLALFMDSKDSHVYNPIEETISFKNRKPTDYKLNKNVILPKALDSEKEFQCELRRLEYMKALNEYNLEMLQNNHCLKGDNKKNKKMWGHEEKIKINEKIISSNKAATNTSSINFSSNKEGMKKSRGKERNERKKKEKTGEPVNLLKSECAAMKSLKKKIKAGSLIISQTDKSARFAVLTRNQYLDSGKEHTKKDKKITWRDVGHLQTKVNNHVWWIAQILQYSESKDSKRMLKNLVNHSLEVPDMALLIKDHKPWQESSGTPVPSRPVVSGNKGVNTHLSEIIAELLEPLVLKLGGGEVSSTEEALYLINDLNKKINNGVDLTKINVLENLSVTGTPLEPSQFCAKNDTDTSLRSESGMTDEREPDTSQGISPDHGIDLDKWDLNLSDVDTVILLEELARERDLTINNTEEEVVCTDGQEKTNVDTLHFSAVVERDPLTYERCKKERKRDIRSYFKCVEKKKKKMENGSEIYYEKELDDNYRAWTIKKEHQLRKEADTSSSLDTRIQACCKASDFWSLNQSRKINSMKKKGEGLTGMGVPPIQDMSECPVFIGGDAVALYPSMDEVGTADMIFQAVRDTDIRFEDIDYKRLAVYLYLMIGPEYMRDMGLDMCIPARTINKKSRARSLAAKMNRDMMGWHVDCHKMKENEKRTMVALMIKLSVIVIMNTTCYSFGGELFLQSSGAGIGLRASACIAKIIMGLIDRMWASVNSSFGLIMAIYLRYIDDLRSYMFPISAGWQWSTDGWCYNEEDAAQDTRTPMERTRQELAKSLTAMVEFIKFTTESEEDYQSKFLPTLDMQTQVQNNGSILYKFFRKPMANNLAIQFGTALPKNTVFSALRQDLVRRMLNCSTDLSWADRLKVIEDYIQLLVNSGHSFRFIKAVILQGLTRYKFMLNRAALPVDHPKFMPLYRERRFQGVSRCIMKYVEGKTWYKDLNLGDQYRKHWKKRLFKYGHEQKRRQLNEHDARDTVCAMFVPPSVNSRLTEKIILVEEKLKDKLDWKVKILEQSGTPLAMTFLPKFDLLIGCPKGEECVINECKGIKCAPRRVVYSAVCTECKKAGSADDGTYIGETCRPLRERAAEHNKNLVAGDMKSFQLVHWMDCHGTCTAPPRFEFKVIARYEDALRRQLCEGLHILKSGTLNRKVEFNNNVISRLEVPDLDVYQEKWLKEELETRTDFKNRIRNFINVMSNVLTDWPCNNEKKMRTNDTDLYSCRIPKKIQSSMEGKRKRQEIEASTPSQERREVVLIPLDESPIESASARDEGDSNNTSTGSDAINTEKKKAGISDELDTAVITPVKELSSGTFDTNMFWGAENLSRAGVGKVGELDNEEPVVDLTHSRNWFAIKKTTDEPTVHEDDDVVYPMDIVEPEKKPALVLGSGASNSILNERGCLKTFSPKRQFPGTADTPAKRFRANNLASSSASPFLKKTQDYKEQASEGSSNKHNEERKKKDNSKPKRIAANFNKVGKRGVVVGASQPLINTVFKKVDDQAEGNGDGDRA